MSNIYYSFLGMKIASDALIIGDWLGHHAMDLGKLELGANSVAFNARIQLHTFEDWRYWSQKTTIGSDCVLGAGSLVIGGSRVGQGVVLGPGSVVMKNEVMIFYGGGERIFSMILHLLISPHSSWQDVRKLCHILIL